MRNCEHLGIIPPLATRACRNLHINGLSDSCKGMFAAAQNLIHSWQIFTFSICADVLQFNTVFSVCYLLPRFRSALCLCNAESRCLSATDFRRWSITVLHNEQNISPSSTWNVPVGYLLDRELLNWAEGGNLPSWSKKQRAFLLQTYP